MKTFFLLLFIIYSSLSFAQKKYKPLTIGDKVPIEIWNKIPKKKTTKLVILDFWSTGCISCMEAFPKMEALQKEFNDELQIVLVNPWESEKEVKERLERINNNRRKNEKEPFVLLNTIKAITGSKYFEELFPARTIPQHVWVKSDATIQYITAGYNANSVNIESVLSNQKVNMSFKNDLAAGQLFEKGYLQPTLNTMPAVYYSAFIPFYSSAGSISGRLDTAKGTFTRTFFNMEVIDLIRTAFRKSGEEERLVFDVKDKEPFNKPNSRTEAHLIDDWNRKYVFTYELQMPLKDKDNWQIKMQQDVNYFFGNMFGIEGVMEKRDGVEVLVVKDKTNQPK